MSEDSRLDEANDAKNPYGANPKDVQGMKKPPLHLVPATASLHEAMAFLDGASKYGPYNWREHPVMASVYVSAAKRHLDLWFEGQQTSIDSDVHNLGAARACLAILIDAEAYGNLIDDRPPPASEVIEVACENLRPKITELVERWKRRLAGK